MLPQSSRLEIVRETIDAIACHLNYWDGVGLLALRLGPPPSDFVGGFKLMVEVT